MNLLTENLITIATDTGKTSVTLPGVLAGLAADRIKDFPRLRPHHRHAAHMFFCQLAAMALVTGGQDGIPEDEETWRDLLRGLTAGFPGDEPWHLAIEDVAKPAFLQAPLAGEAAESLKHREECHDDIDIIVTSRNHAIKRSRNVKGRPDDWMFTLIAYQTLAKYAGKGNYGVARMSSGYSARPFVGLTTSLRPGPHWKRDVAVMVKNHAAVAADNGLKAKDGLKLLWLEPWNGSDQIVPTRLDPWFIEISRVIRLIPDAQDEGRFIALRGASKATRISTGDKKEGLKGLIGDPWAPVNLANGAMFNPPAHIDHELLARVLFDGRSYRPALLQRVQDQDAGAQTFYIVFRCISGGEGKATFNEFIIPVPGRVALEIGKPEDADTIGDIMRDMLGDIHNVTQRALRPAIFCLDQGGSRKIDFDDMISRVRVEPHMEQMTIRLRGFLFASLWNRINNAEAGHKAWMDKLIAAARQTLDTAIRSTPLSTNIRNRAIAGAETVFDAKIATLINAARNEEAVDA